MLCGDPQGRCYIITNEGGATNFKVVTAPASDPKKASWRLEVPPRPDIKIEDLDMFQVRVFMLAVL